MTQQPPAQQPSAQHTSSELAGRHIVITRPAHQAEPICQRLEAAGANVIRFPLLDIKARTLDDKLSKQFKQLDHADMVIFISPNAVSCSLAWTVVKQGLASVKIISAIGSKTAASLQSYGLQTHLQAPPPYNSEALLAVAELQQLSAKRIIIFKGKGGRTLLAETLSQRGAHVETIDVYERCCPQHSSALLQQSHQAGKLDIIVISSGQSLQNLFEITPKNRQDWILQTTLLLGSPRIAQYATRLGYNQAPLLASNPSDETLYQALLEWSQKRSESESQ